LQNLHNPKKEIPDKKIAFATPSENSMDGEPNKANFNSNGVENPKAENKEFRIKFTRLCEGILPCSGFTFKIYWRI